APEIAVHLDEERETLSEFNTAPLFNPEEEQPYHFQHVVLGATGGDGTFENPFGTVQEALNATVGDGNDVVYVDGNNAVNIPAFTIPERVRVLSQGPAQTLAGLPFPGFETRAVRLPFSTSVNFAEGIAVDLPLSGDGNFPNITDGVTLGNRTVLAGFRIENAAGDAISGSNIRNAELRNNTITNPGGRGIALNNVGGSVVTFNNIIRNPTGSGIFAENTTSAQRIDLSIIGYEVTGSGNIGLEFVTLPTGGALGAPSQVIAVGPSDANLNTSQGNSGGEVPANAITNSTNQGIVLRSEGTARNNASTQELSFDAGLISGNGGSGVLASSDRNGGSQEISVTNSTISNNAGAGVEVVNGVTVLTDTASAQELFLRNNEILDNDGSGVDVTLNALGAQEITVNDNRILRNGGDGIRSVANSGLQEFPILEDGSAGITNNTISGNAEQAIDVVANGDAVIAVLNVRNNTLESNSGGANVVDIDVEATSTDNSVCTVLLNNTVPTGIALTTFSNNPTDQALYLVQNLNTVSFENNGALVQLINGNTGLPDVAAFSNEVNFCIP
ncbi:MAG: right-handed parallel beta-helix repeat-containing protein, partial [Cyanobacteria bacterium P01_C01_bin.70]